MQFRVCESLGISNNEIINEHTNADGPNLDVIYIKRINRPLELNTLKMYCACSWTTHNIRDRGCGIRLWETRTRRWFHMTEL